MSQTALAWILFNLFVFVMLVLDLTVFHRKAHEIKIKEALLASALWISLALFFCVGLFFVKGHDVALTFLAGYLIEESLSVDNLFVFLLIFAFFKVPAVYQHRVLFWGIVGALLLRAFFIIAGVAIIHRFEWVIYLFGAFLVFTGFKLAFGKEKEVDPEKNIVIRLFRRVMPVTDQYAGDKFFVRNAGRLFATPLLVVLLVIETTDVIFAIDSIPAVLSISTDPFIVYTSNIFAILGLRSIFFALAGLMKLFHYLNYGLAVILTFVGVKMLVSHFYKIPVVAALGVIAGVLTISIAASILFPKKGDGHASPAH